MRISCKLCGWLSESLIIDKEIAFKECVTKNLRHIQQKHEDRMKQFGLALSAAINAFGEWLHFSEFVNVPEEETFIGDKLDNDLEIVMKAMGYDPGEDEEEDDEDEGDDNDLEEDEEPVIEVEPDDKSMGGVEIT